MKLPEMQVEFYPISQGSLGIISKLNDAKKDKIISSLSQPPLPPQKNPKKYTHLASSFIWYKTQGYKGF